MPQINNIKQHSSEAYGLPESFGKVENNFRAIEKAPLLMSKSQGKGLQKRGEKLFNIHFSGAVPIVMNNHSVSLLHISPYGISIQKSINSINYYHTLIPCGERSQH